MKEQKNKILLIYGPQGSGNHLFSKIFALHDDVCGWKELLDDSKEENYFIPHYKQPNIDYWKNVDDINIDIMNGKKYAVLNASVPLWNRELMVPPFNRMFRKLQELNIEVQPVVIGRDKTILTHQQTRLRGGPTWGVMTQVIRRLEITPFYVSLELLYLYRRNYIRDIGKWLQFPVADTDPRIDEILKEDSNQKYIVPAANPFVDKLQKTQGYHIQELGMEPFFHTNLKK